MTLELRCADVGFDCSFTAQADSEEARLEEVAAHGAKAHGIEEIDEAPLARVKAEIQEV